MGGIPSDNLLFKVEIAPDKENTVLKKVQQAFKQVGIEIADDIHIVAGDLSNSFKISEKDTTYIVLFVGETTLEVYDGNIGYSVRPQWTTILSDLDPRFGSPTQNLVQTIPIYPNRFGNCLKNMRVN